MIQDHIAYELGELAELMAAIKKIGDAIKIPIDDYSICDSYDGSQFELERDSQTICIVHNGWVEFPNVEGIDDRWEGHFDIMAGKYSNPRSWVIALSKIIKEVLAQYKA